MVNMDSCIEINETRNFYRGGYTNWNPFLYINETLASQFTLECISMHISWTSVKIVIFSL